MDRYNIAYAGWIVRNRWLTIAVSLIVAAAAVMGARGLVFNGDYRLFFSPDNPRLKAFDLIERTYTKTDNILFVVKANDGDIFQRETLDIIKQMTDDAWQMPYSSRVDSVTNYQHTYAEDDDLTVRDLVPAPLSLTEDDLAGVKSVAMTDPLIAKRLVAPDGRATGVFVTLQIPDGTITPEEPIIAYARAMISKYAELAPDLTIVITGITPLNYAFFETSVHDMQVLTPLMYLFLAITLAIFLRSGWGVLVTLFIIALSAASAMGIAGWLGIEITPPVAIAPTIILTIAVANPVHFLVTMFTAMRTGMGRKEAVIESLRLNAQPIFLTSITTAIGFTCLNFGDAPPFGDLGNVAAIGTLLAWAYAMTFLPAIVSLLPVSSPRRSEAKYHPLDRLAETVIARRMPLLVLTSLLALGLIALIPRLEMNETFVHYMDKGTEFRDGADFANTHLTGVYSLEYSLSSNEPGGVSNPAYMANLDKFADWYRQQPGVTHVNPETDIMKRLNRNMHGDDDAWYKLPEDRELAAQYLLLYEMSLPYGLDLNNQINVDKSSTRLTVLLSNLSTTETKVLLGRADDWQRENLPAHMFSTAASATVMFTYLAEKNVKSMLVGTLVAFGLISTILMIALRSLRLGLISLIPNMVPAFMAFGIWAIFSTNVGWSVAFVTVTALGIIVDATVHFLSKYLRARREQGHSSEDAVRYAFSTVGAAIWISALVLMVGFSVLAFSVFRMNGDMGLLTAVTIGVALLIDFTLLPALLITLDKKDRTQDVQQTAPA
ncbi:MAG: MMPL family transporter [Rhodospirillales bacterium]|nr:MMPL family transporter [Rhodospirillales bacterium]